MQEKVINEKRLEDGKDYSPRGIVGRFERIGSMQVGILHNMPVYKFLTLDCGPGRDSLLVEFSGVAPHDPVTKEIDFGKLKEGDIIVTPGLLYKKRDWTGPLIAGHLAALKNYRRRVIIDHEVDKSAGQIDLGVINSIELTEQ